MLVRPLDGYEPQGRERLRENDFIGLSDITGFVRRYLVSIAGFFVAGALLATFLVTTADRTYSAGAQILIEPKLPQYLQQQTGGVTTSLDTAQVESQIAVMRSEKIAQMVIDQLSLMENPDFFILGDVTLAQRLDRFAGVVAGRAGYRVADIPWLSAALPKAAGDETSGQTLTPFERQRLAIDIFGSNIDIRRVGVSYAVAIVFRSRNAGLAAEIANATAENFVREQIETKAAAARQGGQWLEERMAEMRTKMNTATQVVQEFRSRHDYSVREPGAQLINGQIVYKDETQAATGAPTLEELEVTADTYRQMYESFLLAYTNNLSQQSYPVADARIITPATRPLTPSYPRTKLAIAFGALAGLLSGVAVAFLRHTLDSTIRSRRQVHEQIGLRCLGELPARRGPNDGTGRYNEVAAAPNSTFTQNLKRAKFEILLEGTAGSFRSIGVTSPLSTDSKRVVASNLALLFAMSGKRTVLIDADPDPSIPAGRLRAAKIPGRSETSRDTVGRGIGSKALPGVDVWSSATSDPKDAFVPPDWSDYDIAVVNLPPLASGPENLAASADLDGVLLVAEWGRTPVGAAAELASVLKGHQANILGVMLTKVRFLSSQPRRRANKKSWGDLHAAR